MVKASPVAKRSPRAVSHAATNATLRPIVRAEVRRFASLAALYEGIMGTPPKREPRRRGPAALSLYSHNEAASLVLVSLPVLAVMTTLGFTLTPKPHRQTELAMRWPEASGNPRTPTATSPVTVFDLRDGETGPPHVAIAPMPPPPADPALPAQFPLLALPPSAVGAIAPIPYAAGIAADQAPVNATAAALPSPALAADESKVAILTPAPVVPALASREDSAPPPAVCEAPASLFSAGKRQALTLQTANLTPAAFGRALARAALEQTHELVIYNDKYRALAYPMGDVQPLYGVCTDVVIRAYRAVGIDLQQRVHEARTGGGDTSIDHRRTETLRRFFARYGRPIAPTSIAEDYVPGDIVTYNRPQNRHSRSHIAMVSDVVAPSGRYMIIHNRGWGPQLEDGLFVDEITGHYRYDGSESGVEATPVAMVASAVRRTSGTIAAALPDRGVTERIQMCRPGPKGLARTSCIKRETLAVRQDGKPVKGLGR